ncbi:hypothetical protein FRC01_008361 [Tulasnella sp. 417]|nr:hypothetical protein FRC01_008361 [Tulasnella sp. 417]
MPLRVGFIPLELCVRPGEAALDLLVFVSSHMQGNWEPGGYITALQINLGAVDPEFVLLGTLDVQKFCSGLRLQGDAVVATLFWPGDEQCEFLIWDWKTGARVTLPSPGPGEEIDVMVTTGLKGTFQYS